MVVIIKELMGGADTLYGVPTGRSCLAHLLQSVAEPDLPTVLFLDFGGVASATVSFLREGPLAFRSTLRARGSNLYPVFANLTESVADSLSDYLIASKDAVFACELSADDAPCEPKLIGHLEPAQRDAFDEVRLRGEVTAVELANDSRAGVGPTAWNNRLSALAAKGLLMESRTGRRKTYKITLAEA